MTYFDLGRLYRRIRYSITKHLGEHVVDLEILAGPIAREVSLAAAEYVNAHAHFYVLGLRLFLPLYRETESDANLMR